MAKSPIEKSKTLTRSFTQPADTVQYVVKQTDTLESIAARAYSTPSEIKNINRLGSRTLFPGQLLYVPADIQKEDNKTVSSNGVLPSSSNAIVELPNEESAEQEAEAQEKFLKINSRYITDGKGVVSGVLLVTPNCVMFDPNVSDPLIMEQGTEMYRVNFPLAFVIKAGMYQDMAHMRIKDKIKTVNESPKPKVYVPTKNEGDPLRDADKLLASVSLESGDSNLIADMYSKSQNPQRVTLGSNLESLNELPAYKTSSSEKPELFSSFHKLIPRPSRSSNDAPLYLCLRMGKLITLSSPNQISASMDQFTKLRSDYWFSIPHDKIDTLYYFFDKWTPGMYGEVDDFAEGYRNLMPFDDSEDSDDSDAEPPVLIGPFTKVQEKIDDSIKKELELPELLDNSEILDETNLKQLFVNFPPRTIGNQMKLFYTTSKNGFSLQTLYRRLANDYDGPVLLVIQDAQKEVFGAMCSSPFRCSELFYGTGESFLYTFQPEFKVYKWSGENSYFIKGDSASLVIGSGNGTFGIWLDGDLYRGRTQPCITYKNPILTSNEDFVVRTIEVWGFI